MTAETSRAAARRPELGIHPSVEEYDAACRSLVEGRGAATGPVPAIAGPHLDRYLRLAGGPSSLTWATIDPTSAVAVRSGDRYARFARLLAALTGRRLHEVDANAALRPIGGATTFVVQPEALTVDLLASTAQPLPVGILTARGDDAMAALVARTVTRPARPGEGPPRWLDLDSLTRPEQHLFQNGRSATDRAGHLDLLTVRGHSRGCCLHLPDGLFCGREPDLADDERIRPALGGQLSSCAQGEGCFRLAIGRGQRQPVRDVAAGVLLLDGCHSLQVAGGQSPAEISMALAAMDGTSVAVVATPWLRFGPRIPGPLLAALIASGHGLGAAVAILNECIAADAASVGLFTLLGDAGLVPDPDGREHVHELRQVPSAIACPARCGLVRLRLASELPPLIPRLSLRASGPLHAIPLGERELVVFGDGEGAFEGELRASLVEEDAGAFVEGRARRALRRLRIVDVLSIGVGPRVNALDRMVRELGRAWFQPLPQRDEQFCMGLVSRLESAMDDVHRAVVEQCVDQHATTFDTIPDTWRGPLALGTEGSFRCPTCNRVGERHSITPRAVPDARFSLLSCPYCSVVSGGHEDADFTMAVSGPDHVARNEPFHYDVEIVNVSTDRLRGVVGACVSGEEHIDARFRQLHDVRVDGAEPLQLRLSGSFPSPRSSADRSFVVVVACVNGGVQIAYRCLWLRTDPAWGVDEPENVGGDKI